jgi:hypothetical protein
VSGSFKLIIKDSAKVDACSGNIITLSENDKQDSRDENVVSYKIPLSTDNTDNVQEIRPLVVTTTKSMTECPLEIKAYWTKTVWNEEYQSYDMMYAEIRDDNQYTQVKDFMNYENNDPYFTLDISQEQYITEFARMFSYDAFSTPPKYTTIGVTFEIVDPTDESTKQWDSFRIEIESSGQKATDFCDYSDLQVVADTEKSGQNYYKVDSQGEILIQT